MRTQEEMARGLGPTPYDIGPALTQSPPDTANAPPPAAGAAGRKSDGLMAKWNDWMSSPEGNSFLMQFGINMLQPTAPGQSAAGHIGAAVGAGMEAMDERTKQNFAAQTQTQENALKLKADARDEAKNASDIKLQGAQADYYSGRNGVTGTGGTKTLDAQTRYIQQLTNLWTRLSNEAEISDDESIKQTADDTLAELQQAIADRKAMARAPAAAAPQVDTQASVFAEAKRIIAEKPALRQAIIDRVRQRGFDPTGL